MNKKLWLHLVLIPGLLTALLALAETATEPVALVRDTTERMLDKLEKERIELEAQPGTIYRLIDDIVVPHFDFSRIARFALGRYWPRASEAQKHAFTEEFKILLVRTYAKALLNYSGQKITYLPLRLQPESADAQVETLVREEGGPSIPINYRLYRNGTDWKVYDIVIDGVSLVSNYRTSFASQIRQIRIEGLIDLLRKRNAGSDD